MRSEETPLDAAIRGLARGARRLDRVIEAWRPAAWLELDRRIRSAIGQGEIERPAHPWTSTNRLPGALRAALRAPAPTEAGLALALCDPSGLIRQAALPHAARRPAVLPLVAVRTTDWVPAVRDRAREILTAALPGADGRTLGVTVPVLLQLRRRTRGDAAGTLLDETLRAAPDESLTALLRNRDRATRRLAVGIALERGLLTPAELAKTATYDNDIAVQDMAATAALAAGVPDETLPLLLAARPSRVRAAGITALHGAGRTDEAEPFLYDRSGLVRACARWVLRQAGRDPLALYRAACADPSTVPGWAPYGLAECGDRDDADIPVLRALTAHPVARVRASAVAGLRILEPQEWRGVLPLLDDPSAAVAREVENTLVDHAYRIPEEDMLTRAAPDRPYRQRAAALRVLSARYGTARLRCALRMLDDPDPRLRARAVTVICRDWWSVRHFDPAEAEEILLVLERNHDAVPRLAASRIREALRPRG
ncbi:hypothetical protein [Streptomyces sp. NPDC053541]|uniref:hypothetical protein n=1 Tax=Streptomyces sp. NPDC053541 TaxID=3365709 RepID=UPI0037D473A9